MNVSYENINTNDAATMLGVHYTTVAYWCRHKLIRYTDISDGTNKARYMFTADELDRVNNLIIKGVMTKCHALYSFSTCNKSQKIHSL